MQLEKALLTFVMIVFVFGILGAIAAGNFLGEDVQENMNQLLQTDVLFSNPFEGISGIGVFNPGSWLGATVTYVLAWVKVFGFPVGVFFGGAASAIAGVFVIIGGILMFALIRSFFGR
jgi:hypothetical protein